MKLTSRLRAPQSVHLQHRYTDAFDSAFLGVSRSGIIADHASVVLVDPRGSSKRRPSTATTLTVADCALIAQLVVSAETSRPIGAYDCRHPIVDEVSVVDAWDSHELVRQQDSAGRLLVDFLRGLANVPMIACRAPLAETLRGQALTVIKWV